MTSCSVAPFQNPNKENQSPLHLCADCVVDPPQEVSCGSENGQLISGASCRAFVEDCDPRFVFHPQFRHDGVHQSIVR